MLYSDNTAGIPARHSNVAHMAAVFQLAVACCISRNSSGKTVVSLTAYVSQEKAVFYTAAAVSGDTARVRSVAGDRSGHSQIPDGSGAAAEQSRAIRIRNQQPLYDVISAVKDTFKLQRQAFSDGIPNHPVVAAQIQVLAKKDRAARIIVSAVNHIAKSFKVFNGVNITHIGGMISFAARYSFLG